MGIGKANEYNYDEMPFFMENRFKKSMNNTMY